MSLFLVMIYSVRENALRMRIKETADISIKSSVAEYQRTLWDRYGLIFTDAGYGNKAVSMILTEERLKECMNRNFDELPDVPLFGKDLLKLKCDSCEAANVRFATDYGGAPLIKQAADYMEHRYGIEYVTGLYELAAQCNDYEFSALSLKEKLESATDKLKGVKNAPEIKEWTDRLENAVIGEGPVSPSVLLPLVMKEVSKLSDKRIKKEN